MSGYGPPRGWRGSNAWSTASSERPDAAVAVNVPADPAARLRVATFAHIAQGRLSAPEYAEADVTAVLDELEQLRVGPEVVWLTQDDEGNFGVWRDPDNARKQIIQGWAAETPGDYEWVNDADGTHEVLLRDGELAGVTLWMACVADAAPRQLERENGDAT